MIYVKYCWMLGALLLFSGLTFAQPGYVDLKNGERIEGIIDLTDLKNEGIITLSARRTELSFTADDMTGFFVHQSGFYYVKSISIYREDNVMENKDVILKPLIESSLNFWEAFGMSFDFVAGKSENYHALQYQYISTTEKVNDNDSPYKKVLIEVLMPCKEIILSDSFALTEEGLLELSSIYDECTKETSRKTKKRLNISAEIGHNDADLEFNVVSNSLGDRNEVYDLRYKSQEVYFGVGIQVIDLIKNMDFGASIEVAEYNFSPILTDSILAGGSLDYMELKPKIYLEPRLSYGRFSGSIKTGVSFNLTLRDNNDALEVEVIQKGRRFDAKGIVTPKFDRNMRTTATIYVFAAPTLSIQISEKFDLGISYYFKSDIEERVTAENDASDDRIRQSAYSARLIYRLQ